MLLLCFCGLFSIYVSVCVRVKVCVGVWAGGAPESRAGWGRREGGQADGGLVCGLGLLMLDSFTLRQLKRWVFRKTRELFPGFLAGTYQGCQDRSHLQVGGLEVCTFHTPPVRLLQVFVLCGNGMGAFWDTYKVPSCSSCKGL